MTFLMNVLPRCYDLLYAIYLSCYLDINRHPSAVPYSIAPVSLGLIPMVFKANASLSAVTQRVELVCVIG